MVTANNERSLNLMLSLISPLLLLVAIASSTINKSWHRVKCALAVLLPTVAHYVYFDHLQTVEYYISAMAFNAMTISILEIIKRGTATRLIVHLQLFSLAFMTVNFAGAMIWYSYLSPSWYNALCLVLAIAEAARIFLHTDGDKRDGIDSRDNNRRNNDNKRFLGGRG